MPALKEIGPAGWVKTIIGLQLALLVTIPALSEAAPPFDVVEELAWAPHWLLGTEKHPTLPSWLIEMMHYVIPDPVLGPLILSEVCIGLTYWFVFRIGCLLLDPLRAAAGTLLLLGSYYFSAPTIEFNHNVLQMPIWAGLVLLVAKLRRNPTSWPIWIGIGVAGGLGLWVKYSIALLYVVLFIIGLIEAPIRRRLLSLQPYVMVALIALIWWPHFHWLLSNDFLPMRYAQSRLAEEASAWGPVSFFLNQILSNIVMLVLVVLAIVGSASAPAKDPAIHMSDRIFLWLVTIVPLALAMLFLASTGSAGKSMWGMPMFTTLGLLAVAEFPVTWTMARLRRLGYLGIFILILVPTLLVISIPYPFTGHILRSAWPMRDISAKADALWHRSETGPLKFVGGDPWIAGLIVVADPVRPSIINGDVIGESPWVDPAAVASVGGLYVSPNKDEIAPYCHNPSPPEVVPVTDPRIPPIYARVCHGSTSGAAK